MSRDYTSNQTYPRKAPLMFIINSAEEEEALRTNLYTAIELGKIINRVARENPGRYWLRVSVPSGLDDPDVQLQLIPDDTLDVDIRN